MKNSFPILEHDYISEAKIDPSSFIKPRDVPEHCVISFFCDVNEKVISEKQATVVVSNHKRPSCISKNEFRCILAGNCDIVDAGWPDPVTCQ